MTFSGITSVFKKNTSWESTGQIVCYKDLQMYKWCDWCLKNSIHWWENTLCSMSCCQDVQHYINSSIYCHSVNHEIEINHWVYLTSMGTMCYWFESYLMCLLSDLDGNIISSFFSVMFIYERHMFYDNQVYWW